MNTDIFCFCDSGIEYAKCCGLFHSGKKKPMTAVDLMRSRFSAYTLHNTEYLLNNQAGRQADRIEDIRKLVDELISSPALLSELRNNALKIGNPHSAVNIAAEILR